MNQRLLLMAIASMGVLVFGCEPRPTAPNPTPEVIGTEPANQSVNVPHESNRTFIAITFNTQMVPVATAAAISANPPIAGAFTWSYAYGKVIWTPGVDLAVGTLYTVTVAPTASLGGILMAGPHAFSFTTNPLLITSTIPTNTDSGVSINSTIAITFNTAMDTSSAQAALSANPPISGTFAWDPAATMVIWTPGLPLAMGTAYTVTLSTGAAPQAGTPLAADYVFSFITAP